MSDVQRNETYAFHRFGGGGAVGVRVATKHPHVRLTASTMIGAVAMANIYDQSATATSPAAGATNVNASQTSATTVYGAPLLTFDAGVLVGWPGGVKFHISFLTMVQFAGGPVNAPAQNPTNLGGGQYQTGPFQVANGTQVFMGPMIGFDFGL